jgi:phosphoglycolate phosphatase/beta-phosphoglucomutase
VLRAILFDFNGVLVDDEPIHLETFQRVLADEGIAFTTEDDHGRTLGLDDRGRFAAVLAAAGEEASVPRLMRLLARKSAYYQERIRKQGYPFVPGAPELVRELAASGRMLGIVTGALRDEVEGALRQAGLRDLFKVLVTAEEVEKGKPDPEGYLRALEGLSSLPPLPARLIHPHEVLAVEDSPAGLAAAAEVGLVTLDAGLRGMTLARLEQLFAEVSRQ